MAMALLQRGLDDRLGDGRAQVWSLGFGPEGLPAIPAAVEAMRRRGLDIDGHRSRRVTLDRLESADLVLASERQHVVGVAGLSPALFRSTFTMPEFLERVASDPRAAGRSLARWAADLSADRVAAEYLRSPIGEVADPTGLSSRRFERATASIESMCGAVVDAVVRGL
jgi:protein-tyrosine-phosphatase